MANIKTFTLSVIPAFKDPRGRKIVRFENISRVAVKRYTDYYKKNYVDPCWCIKKSEENCLNNVPWVGC